ncbi:hypothetical protein FPOA_12058 [Fusarium poae]|uniref:HAT C-terminal dimerisation domain-containing protein n=1 Tax=Fusarium poae TaxID=36050 RepID=A0A1B8AAA1_FUSPO|nr:hypothetical protein FPOA_12058 [Fusarium poae]
MSRHQNNPFYTWLSNSPLSPSPAGFPPTRLTPCPTPPSSVFSRLSQPKTVAKQLEEAAVGALPPNPTIENLPRITWKNRRFVQEDLLARKGAKGRKSWIRSHGTFLRNGISRSQPPRFVESALPSHSRADYSTAEKRSASETSQKSTLPADHRAYIRASINNGWKKLNEYYDKLGESPLFAAAIILHPRFGISWLEATWVSEEQLAWVRDAKAGIKDYFTRWYDANQGLCEETRKYDAAPRTMGQEDDQYTQWINSKTKKAFATGGSVGELERYLRLEPQNTQDAIEWWRDYRASVLSLSSFALDVFAIPAMRLSMGADTLEHVQCLKNWVRQGGIIPKKHLQAELGPKRRKTKGHRAYVCLHCQNPPWSNRVPGNAIHHAETAHRALIRASEAANDTPSTFASGVLSGAIDSYIVSRPSQAALRNCFNKQAYIEAVVGLLARRRLPFSAVEHSELRDLALACNPAIGDLLINDRKQAMGYINSNYSLYSSQLAERIQTQSKIHISSDLWTSPHRHGVLAVCVQWVDEDFKLQKALLGLPECKYGHSGATQAELVAGTLRKFNITAQSLGYYIGDNAASNETCLEELSKILEAESGAEYPHKRRRIRCIGHIINLALQAFLLARSKEALRAALEATADEPGSTMLEEFSQQLHELDPAEIVAHSDTTTHQEQRQEERQEQPTRKLTHARGKRATTTHQQASNVDERFAGWQGIPALAKLHALAVYIRSSALHNDQWYDAVVITVALKKKPQIIQFTAEHDNDLEGNTLSSRDWEMLERTLEFLQPFYEATLEAEGAMASISQSLELLDLLLGHCEKWKAHYSQPSNRDDRIIHSINMCWFILDKYYTMTEDVPVYAAALLLDPSKRKSYIEECWPEEWHECAFAAARCLWKEEYNHDVEIHLSEQSLAVPALLKRKKDTMLSKMRLEVRNKTMARARGKDDFDSFISEAPIALAEDTTPLQWWCSEDVRTAYPRLSRMAIDILSVPAESAEPERTFSGARRTARWDRLRLLIENIEKIECIGNWLREGHIRPSAEGGIGLPCDPEAIEGDI